LTLFLLSRRVIASVHPAHALGALLVAGLLLSTFVTDDALVMATNGPFRVGRFSLCSLPSCTSNSSPSICPMVCLVCASALCWNLLMTASCREERRQTAMFPLDVP